MTDYDGLNLPQLLELMHGFVLPKRIPLTPQTIGWVIIGGWLLLVSALLAHSWWHRYQANRYRRDALRLLQDIRKAAPHDQAAAIADLLKRTAIAAYGRDRAGSLCGSQWAQFLVQTSNHDPAVTAGARALAQAAYRPVMDAEPLHAPARRWIAVHRA